MSFNIQPIREFVVRPALPPQLSRMSELAYNLLWAWESSIRALFRRLDLHALEVVEEAGTVHADIMETEASSCGQGCGCNAAA